MFIGKVRWKVILQERTMISGTGINNGVPIAATIAYQLDHSVFIIARVLGFKGNDLKMVKIEVTGEKSFLWLEAKSDHVTSDCQTQETFNINCYRGTSGSEQEYNVAKLVAVSRSGMSTLAISHSFCLVHIKISYV